MLKYGTKTTLMFSVCSLNKPDSSGYTLLHRMVRLKKVEYVKILVNEFKASTYYEHNNISTCHWGIFLLASCIVRASQGLRYSYHTEYYGMHFPRSPQIHRAGALTPVTVSWHVIITIRRHLCLWLNCSQSVVELAAISE